MGSVPIQMYVPFYSSAPLKSFVSLHSFAPVKSSVVLQCTPYLFSQVCTSCIICISPILCAASIPRTTFDHLHHVRRVRAISVLSASWIICISPTPEGRPGMSHVSPLSGISGLSFDSTLLSPLLFFCLVLLPFLSYRFLPAGPFF